MDLTSTESIYIKKLGHHFAVMLDVHVSQEPSYYTFKHALSNNIKVTTWEIFFEVDNIGSNNQLRDVLDNVASEAL